MRLPACGCRAPPIRLRVSLPWNRRRFASCIQVAYGSRTCMPEKPVPRMASTTPLARSNSRDSSSGVGATSTESGHPCASAAVTASSAAVRAGSAESCSGGRGHASATGHPACASARPHTQPSPPLFPLPVKIKIGAGSGTHERIWSAMAHPARSINAPSEVPQAAMRCSNSTIFPTSSTCVRSRICLMPSSVMMRVSLIRPLSMMNGARPRQARHARMASVAAHASTPAHHIRVKAVLSCTHSDASARSSAGVVGISSTPATSPNAHAGSSTMANKVA